MSEQDWTVPTGPMTFEELVRFEAAYRKDQARTMATWVLWERVGACAAIQWLWHMAIDEGHDHVCDILVDAFDAEPLTIDG